MDLPALPANLAKASWVSVLLVGAVTYAAGLNGPDSSGATSAVLMIVYALLLIIGFGCGVTALSGVRKHGRKGVLIPALIGSTLSLGLLVLMSMVFIHSFRAGRVQGRINAAAAELQKGLPKKCGTDTECSRVLALPGELVLDYTILNHKANEIDSPKFIALTQPQATDLMCRKMAPAIDVPVNFRVRYTAADGVRFAEFVIKATECSRPKQVTNR